MYVLAHGKEVHVAVEIIRGIVPAIKITATYGSTVVESSHSFTALDGPSEIPDPEHVKKSIDRVRIRTAEHAVVREELRRQMGMHLS